ncbi:MAG: aminopeptidase [Chloroflexi bacterium]|nr:aminopeptidase [Chloroflexota bacterium]
MHDVRIDRLAQVLVHYSLAATPNQLFRIVAPMAAAPLVRAVYREAVRAGTHPLMRLTFDGLDEIFYKHANADQLAYVPQLARDEIETVDLHLSIMADENTRALSGVDAKLVAKRRAAMSPISKRMMERSADGSFRWCLTLFPTAAQAQEADMSLNDYADFVFAAGKLDHADPVAAWQAQRAEQERIIDRLKVANHIRIVGPGTDLTYAVAGRTWVNCAGDRNFPDGEVFTGPEEQKTNGFITYSFPAIYMGREVSGIRLEFVDGKVVKATADKGEELLHSLLDMDEGARRLGEVAFGTNYGIQRFSRNILFDEKIGGTVHLALGAAYPETGCTNQSALHWDMICDLRTGGEVFADGTLIHKDGHFVL